MSRQGELFEATVASKPEGVADEPDVASELEVARALLFAAFDQTPSAVIIVGPPKGNIILANRAALAIRGETSAPLVDIPVDDLAANWQLTKLDGTPLEREELPLVRALQGEPVEDLDLQIRRDSGELRRIRAHGVPVRVRSGSARSAVMVFRDTTRDHHLSQSAQRYADIVDHMHMGLHVYQLDPSGAPSSLRMVAANPASERLTGLTAEDLVGKTILECFPGLEGSTMAKQLTKVANGGEPLVFEDLDYGDDRMLTRAWTLHVFPLPERCAGVLFEDVTENRKAQAALRDSELRFRALFEHTHDAVFLFDLHGACVDANDRAVQLLGAGGAAEVQGRHWKELVKPEMSVFVRRQMRLLFAGNPLSPFEVVMSTEAGAQPVEVSAALVRDQEDRPHHVHCVARDISERKAAESALRQTQKLESLGVLAGGVAHDFNNLLTGMLGNASLALEDLPVDSVVRVRVDEIQKAARRAAELTNQLLAYAGRAKVESEPIDLNELTREMTKLLRAAISKKTRIEFSLAEQLPAVRGDAAQIRQVVMNLITNASEALGETGGTVTLSTSVRQLGEEGLRGTFPASALASGSYVQLEVEDDGCGMDDGTRGRIFDPFFTTKFTGRGLGLASVLGIVRVHGGALQVQSEPGGGSLFRVLLPAGGLPPAKRAARPRSKAAIEGSGAVLVIDDEPAVRRLVKATLARSGFEVIEAADGVEGVEIFERERARIRGVLLDLTMPRMNGAETLAALRELDVDAPVILMSGFAEEDAASITDRPTGFLHKPFTPTEMIEKLATVLQEPTRS